MATPVETEMLAIVGFVAAILGWTLIAFPLGIVALRRIKQNGTAGRGWAVAAVTISGIGTVIQIQLGLVMYWSIHSGWVTS